MIKLNKQKAEELLSHTTSQPHLLQHALAVSSAMGAMAKHFGADESHWEAVGLLHDYDYEKYPKEHLQYTEEPLRAAGVDEESIRAILSHGWKICTDVEPQTNLEKSLYTVDALTGLVSATAKMRPNGISDLSASSVTKKLKDKSFAAGVNREVIQGGIEMLGIDRAEVITICIEGMKPHAKHLDLLGKSACV